MPRLECDNIFTFLIPHSDKNRIFIYNHTREVIHLGLFCTQLNVIDTSKKYFILYEKNYLMDFLDLYGNLSGFMELIEWILLFALRIDGDCWKIYFFFAGKL